MPAPISSDLRVCPFCGLLYEGKPIRCYFCRMLINKGAEDVERANQSRRKRLHSRKAASDLLFLIGLLLGGPMMAIGENPRLGLFIVLAAGFASILRRYGNMSMVSNVLIGSLNAAVAASVLVQPSGDLPDHPLATEEARVAFARALADQDLDVLIDTRGGGHIAIWFTAPPAVAGKCGMYPTSEVRTHLKDLGFRRVVVTAVNESMGLCSFAP